MLIVGTDFSLTAAHAMAEARTLAARLEQPIEVAYVWQTAQPPSRPWTAGLDEQAWMEAVGVSEEDLTVRRGTPWVELVRLAAERRAHMIVVGTHGRTGFQPVALGSTAARLALLSPRPILLVGGRERAGEEAPTVGKDFHFHHRRMR